MSVFLRQVAELTGLVRVDHWRAVEPGVAATGAPILPDATATLIVANGEGRARLRVNGEAVGDTDTATEFARVEDERLRAYSAVEVVPEAIELELETEEGQELEVTVVQVTGRGGWLARRLRSFIPCHMCIRIVRAAILALLTAAGIPDPGLGEEVLDVVGDLADRERIPDALEAVLDRLFGGDFDRFLDKVRQFIDNLPFNRVARRICEDLGFC